MIKLKYLVTSLSHNLSFGFLTVNDLLACTSNVSLNPGKLGAVEIPIPPIEEQNRIVELLEKINEIKQTHKEQEAELKQLMPSLLDKAFKGEL